jgi:broad specificity phosphatase PhoE
LKAVYVSPHRRALLTAAHLLENYPEKKSIVLKVLPLAKEILNNTNDLVVDKEELIRFLN